MSHITKNERVGLEELFTAIEKHRYHSRFNVASKWLKRAYHQQKGFVVRSLKAFKH